MSVLLETAQSIVGDNEVLDEVFRERLAIVSESHDDETLAELVALDQIVRMAETDIYHRPPGWTDESWAAYMRTRIERLDPQLADIKTKMEHTADYYERSHAEALKRMALNELRGAFDG